MKAFIATLLRPTLGGVIMAPILLCFELVQIMIAILPGKVAFAIWDILDDITTAMSDYIYDQIKHSKCLWDISIFK